MAIREAVINSIVHNDFTREVPPKFEIFADRIEFTSAGTLPEELDKEDFFDGVSIHSKESGVDARVSGFGIGGATWLGCATDFGKLWKGMLSVYGEFYSHDVSSIGGDYPPSHRTSHRTSVEFIGSGRQNRTYKCRIDGISWN